MGKEFEQVAKLYRNKHNSVELAKFQGIKKLIKYYNRLKSNKDVGFTRDEFLAWLAVSGLACHYCHRDLKIGGWTDWSTFTLDRKDNDMLYTLDNIVPCCRYCNLVKSNVLSHRQMLQVGVLFRLFNLGSK